MGRTNDARLYFGTAKLKLALSGDYLNFDDEDAKLRLLEALRGGGVCSVSVNASGLGSWDSTLVVVLYELVRECLRCNVKISYEKFPPNLRRLIDLAFMVDANLRAPGAFVCPGSRLLEILAFRSGKA